MMATFAGTRALLRLALRLDRVRLPVWVISIAVLPMATAAQYIKLYPTNKAIEQVAGVVTNPSLVAMNGPLFRPVLGGLTAWKVLATELVLVALMNVLTVVRHTRAEEEAGRLELIGAGKVGRNAPLTAALLVVAIADVTIALLAALCLVGVGLPAVGSMAFGLVIGLVGMVFASVAATAAQLTASARSASGIAVAVLGVSYLLRAMGDSGQNWMNWISPIGWGIHLRVYTGERWWVLAPLAAMTIAFVSVAYALGARRDEGAGLMPQRPGPAEAPAGLRTPLALAWRLHRGVLIGWAVGLAMCGAAFGGAADGIHNMVGANEQMTDVLTRLGGRKGLVDAYLAAVFGMLGLVVAAYTVAATLRLRAEESSGRVESLLATRVGRIRWMSSHLLISLLGASALLAIGGISGGLAYGVRIHDVGGQVPRLLASTMVQLPAVAIFAGLCVALFGVAPRIMAGAAWATLIACLLSLELGALLGLSPWLVDISPFAHVPKLPGSAVTVTPLIWLTGIAIGLTSIGMLAFRRRDISWS